MPVVAFVLCTGGKVFKRSILQLQDARLERRRAAQKAIVRELKDFINLEKVLVGATWCLGIALFRQVWTLLLQDCVSTSVLVVFTLQ